MFRARDPKRPDEFLSLMPQQREWLSLYLRENPAILAYYAGGWGAGKSTGGIGFIELAMAMNPGCKGFIIEPTHKMVRNFVNEKFRVAFRDYIIGESKQDGEIFLKNGVTVVYLSGHNLEMLEQHEGAWLFADEVALMKSELIHRAFARTRYYKTQQMIGFAGTPHYGWLQNEFEGDGANETREILHVSTESNHNLPDGYLENFMLNCPARMRRAYIDGYFVPPGGSVYPEFDEDKHVKDFEYQQGMETGVLIDWSPRNPCALFVQILPSGWRFNRTETEMAKTLPGAIVFDELHPDGSDSAVTTEKLCELIKAKGYPLHWAICDPAGKGVEATSGTNQIAIARRMLNTKIIYTEKAELRRIQNGIDMVKAMLEPLVGPPRLFFARNLMKNHSPRATINAIRAYSYPKAKDGKPLSAEPDKDGISDHAMDCIRYLVINKFPVARMAPRVRQYI